MDNRTLEPGDRPRTSAEIRAGSKAAGPMHILRKQACWTAYVGLCLMLQQAGHKKRDHAATEELLTHAFGLEETLARQTGLPALQIINLAMATALAMTKAPEEGNGMTKRTCQFNFKEVPKSHYSESHDAVPPAAFELGRHLVGEPDCHRECTVTGDVRAAYPAFFRVNGRFFEALQGMTYPEFMAVTQSSVLANIVHTSPRLADNAKDQAMIYADLAEKIAALMTEAPGERAKFVGDPPVQALLTDFDFGVLAKTLRELADA